MSELGRYSRRFPDPQARMAAGYATAHCPWSRMKPVNFDYVRPSSLKEALTLLAADPDARLIAGGQSLIPMLAMRLSRPTKLIDILRVPGLSGIRETPAGIEIGATTRHVEVETSAVVAKHLPLLAKAMPWVGHPPIRARGTIGGSLAHGDPAAEVALVAVTLGAEIVFADADGERTLPIADFYLAPTLTALPAAACLTAVRFPRAPTGRRGTAFHEVSARRSDFAIVSAAAQVVVDDDGQCTSLNVGVGGAGDVPLRLAGVAEALVGGKLSDRAIGEAAWASVADLETTADLHASAEYRKRVAGVLAERAIRDARDEALGASQSARNKTARR